jgi:diacylglycerol kinase (ATP)
VVSAGQVPVSETSGLPAHDVGLLYVIVNPASGNGRARKNWPKISATLMTHGLHHDVVFTTGPDDATRIARELATAGARTIVAVGGDGTVNEIINGMMDDNSPVNPETRLLVLPSGTGRDLGRSLGTGQVETAISALVQGSTAKIDLGRISYQTHAGEPATRYFANVADLGLGASVAERLSGSSKVLGGLLTYLVAAVKTIIRYKPTEIVVDVQDDRIFHDSANMVVLANGQYFAGGMRVAPTASICDGLLEMYILTDVGKRALLTSILPRVYRGRHVGREGVLHVRTSSVTIKSPSGMLLEMDGEQIGMAPVRVEVAPRILPVIIAGSAMERMADCARQTS